MPGEVASGEAKAGTAPERCGRVEIRLCSFGSLDVLI